MAMDLIDVRARMAKITGLEYDEAAELIEELLGRRKLKIAATWLAVGVVIGISVTLSLV